MRPFELKDLPEVLLLLAEAKESLKNQGIPQWQQGYPNEESLKEDFSQKVGYVLEESGRIIGYSALIIGKDPSYQNIKGNWLTKGSLYATCHRLMMTRNKSKGSSDTFLQGLITLAKEKNASSLRVDTHEKNQPMRQLLKRQGFELCGEVVLASSQEKRLAFEKKLPLAN